MHTADGGNSFGKAAFGCVKQRQRHPGIGVAGGVEILGRQQGVRFGHVKLEQYVGDFRAIAIEGGDVDGIAFGEFAF